MTTSTPLFSTLLLPTVTAILMQGGPAVARDGATQATAPAAAQATDAAKQRVAADVAKVEAAYLVGPSAAAKLGCSIVWQANVPVPTKSGLQLVSASPDGVLALNTRNEVTLVRPSTGDRAWTASAAPAIDRVSAMRVLGDDFGDRAGSIAVATDTQLYFLSLDNGELRNKRSFQFAPSTLPVFTDSHIVFGSRNGQAVWINAGTGFLFRSSVLDPVRRKPSSIAARPATDGATVVVASSAGTVVAFDASSARTIWRRELLGGVVARPAMTDDIAFVASEDQYLYAFDLGSGETLWKYFTQTPLTAAPFTAGGLVLQDIPGEGLVAFTQKPEGQLGGEVRWKKTGIAGSPITSTEVAGRSAVAFWCPKSRSVTFVDLLKGDTLAKVELPQVEHLEADRLDRGGFVAWSSDGRIERLAPAGKSANAAAGSNG
ncbi:MAG: PQQ-binding-like beta-propeller repeat protein [bacterium]